MKINDLFEERRNANHPAQQIDRVSGEGVRNANHYLEKYKDDPTVYVSFSTIPKLGINPSSSWNTPHGIYCYPLKELFDRKREFDLVVPYAGDRPYMFIIKSKTPLTNMMEYSKNDLQEDIKKIKSIFGETIYNKIIKIYKGGDYNFISPVKQLWKYGDIYARFLSDGELSSLPSRYSNFFRKLGYYGFSDVEGSGTISHMEDTQSVFFSVKYFEILDFITFNNKKEKTKTVKKQIPPKIPNFSKMSKKELEIFIYDHPHFAVDHADKKIAKLILFHMDPYTHKDIFFNLSMKFPELMPEVLDNNGDQLPIHVLIATSKKKPTIIPKLLEMADLIQFDYLRWVLKNYPKYRPLVYSNFSQIYKDNIDEDK